MVRRRAGLIQRMKERAAQRRRDRREAWAEVAERVGGVLKQGKTTAKDVVDVPLGPWTLTLDTYVVSNGQTTVTYTRVRSYFRGHREIRVTVRRRNSFDRLFEALGWASRPPVSPALTDRYVVKGKPPGRVPSLFSPELVAALLSVPSMRLEVERSSRKARRRFGEDAGVVVCRTTGVITDADRLVAMVAIVGATLEALARTGEARKDLALEGL